MDSVYSASSALTFLIDDVSSDRGPSAASSNGTSSAVITAAGAGGEVFGNRDGSHSGRKYDVPRVPSGWTSISEGEKTAIDPCAEEPDKDSKVDAPDGGALLSACSSLSAGSEFGCTGDDVEHGEGAADTSMDDDEGEEAGAEGPEVGGARGRGRGGAKGKAGAAGSKSPVSRARNAKRKAPVATNDAGEGEGGEDAASALSVKGKGGSATRVVQQRQRKALVATSSAHAATTSRSEEVEEEAVEPRRHTTKGTSGGSSTTNEGSMDGAGAGGGGGQEVEGSPTGPGAKRARKAPARFK